MSPSTSHAVAPRRLHALVAAIAARRTAPSPVGTVLRGRELCSAHFISGPGWMSRVTAVLASDRAAATAARRRSA
ncbi:hypothetical protein J421_2854 [Gemmatirosa kalamazoonensis]|uniref:Uncharacterized protein n=1 Tax=Gemmatirosa kalamazoonensis TaxID=861299 RepID=W0RHY7_9BACT|nr:hypothetical protein [Gemmatirosa kalamazoonensis]AHG90391.1 hypothetical protein J421_2854 [Gemmatirosa kalamazoonensis]